MKDVNGKTLSVGDVVNLIGDDGYTEIIGFDYRNDRIVVLHEWENWGKQTSYFGVYSNDVEVIEWAT